MSSLAHSMGGNNHQPGSFGCKQQNLALEQESMERCRVTLRIKGKAVGTRLWKDKTSVSYGVQGPGTPGKSL